MLTSPSIHWPVKIRELHNHHFDSTIWNDLVFRDDDIIIATFAKSGTTWVQQMIGQILFGPDLALEVAEMSPWLDLRVPPKEVKRPLVESQMHRRPARIRGYAVWMKSLRWLDETDLRIARWMARWGPLCLRISLGVIFIWFGVLKPLGMSPAADLVARTVYWVDPNWFLPFLGWWEVAIGACLLIRPLIRVAILLLFLQMPGTALPLILLPEICFANVPFGLTIEGQYIVKNLVLISAALVIGGGVRAPSNPAEKRGP